MAATPPLPRSEILPGVWLDVRLGVFFEHLRLLVVADLHWGYVESHRSRGHLLPFWGDDEIEQRLNGLINDYAPQEMLWLGDSLHTLAGRSRAEQFLARTSLPTIVLAGNHDARWPAVKGRILHRERFCFHHGDQPVTETLPPSTVEVVGHHHPAVRFRDGAGMRLKLPALVASPRRLVLPAFSPWAAGTPWMITEKDESLWAISPRRLFKIPSASPFTPNAMAS
ncbi:MAG TPA: metallophosphoesterase [Opitutaceae bacterium]|nr:metallophosphoesterase [Opitutaceae bacterium]